MLPRRLLPGLVFLLVSCRVAAAQSPPVVEFVPPKTVMMTAGFEHPFELTFRIRAGYAIPSKFVVKQRPLRLEFSPPAHFHAGEVQFPRAEFARTPCEPGMIPVYRGEMIVKARVLAERGTPPGTYSIRGQLQYQGCDDRAAQPPASLPIEFTVRLLRSGPDG